MPDSFVTREQLNALRDSIDRWRAQIQAEQDKQHKSLYGNGEPGMDEMIRALWDDLQSRNQDRKEAAKQGGQGVIERIKANSELKIVVINGTFTLTAIVVTWLLSKP